MVFGLVYVEVVIPQAESLKEKYRVIKSLKQRIRNRFNVSIAEVDYLDKWQRAALGIGIVCTNSTELDSIMGKLESFIHQEFRVSVIRWDTRVV